jgi:hypothetical protein
MLIAAAIGALGTFMPWATIPFLGSISGTQGDGWFTFIAFLVAGIMAVLGNKDEVLTGAKFYAGIAFAGIGSIIGLYEIFNISSSVQGQAVKIVSIGFGLYIIIIAGLVYIGIAFLLKK